MKIVILLRSAIASICICGASAYSGLLAVTLMFKGTVHQVEIDPVIYLGVVVAAAMTLVGYAAAGNWRKGVPTVAALLILGAVARPLTWAISASFARGYWLITAMLVIASFLLIFGAGIVQRRMFYREDAV